MMANIIVFFFKPADMTGPEAELGQVDMNIYSKLMNCIIIISFV